jgi:anti-anti-sigma factor
MDLTVTTQEQGLLSVRIEGEITQSHVAEDLRPLDRHLGLKGFSQPVLFDLQKTKFVDSCGIGWLLLCHRKFRDSGGCMVLCSVPPSIDNVLKVLHLDQLFTIAKDEAAGAKLARGEPL